MRRFSELAIELTHRGAMLNAFGPSPDGDAMLEARTAINSLRWSVAELATMLDLAAGVLRGLGAIDPETDALVIELVAVSHEVVK